MIGVDVRLRRSKLFVPGNRPDFMVKALTTEADCLSLDLEDAVPADYKAEARLAVRTFLEGVETSKEIVVRVNSINSGHFHADLTKILCRRVDVVNLPKVGSAEDLVTCAKTLDHVEKQFDLPARTRIMATIETADGLANIHRILHATPRLTSIQLGLGDLLSRHDMARNSMVANHVRGVVKLAAAAKRLDTLDTAFLGVGDLVGFERDARDALAWGYCGKTCIHPTQVPIANRVFAPSALRVEKAKEIVREYERRSKSGTGAFTLHGHLIDLPVYEEAKRVIVISERIHGANL